MRPSFSVDMRGGPTRMAAVQAALGQLRGVNDVQTVYDRGVKLVCDTCGFDRAAIYRVEGAIMRLERLHFPADRVREDALRLAVMADPPRLTPQLVETQMLRAGKPVLVADAAADQGTMKELVEISGARSYVAAPIQPDGEVIGFIHADRFDSRRDVDDADRDMLATFAEGFGYAVERAMLLQRFRRMRRDMYELTDAARASMDAEEIEIATLLDRDFGDGPAQESEAAAPLRAAAVADVRDLLTRRELEVLELMADGETNVRIAERLVISPTTVKSHVSCVLRKLCVTSRYEAVAYYVRLQQRGEVA